MDVGAAVGVAEAIGGAIASTIIASASASTAKPVEQAPVESSNPEPAQVQPNADFSEEDQVYGDGPDPGAIDGDLDDDDSDELSTIGELYDLSDEDAAEAALDDYLKVAEG